MRRQAVTHKPKAVRYGTHVVSKCSVCGHWWFMKPSQPCAGG